MPRHYASGGKRRNGRIAKRGDSYVRTLLIHGARATLRTAKRGDDTLSHWALAVMERRGTNKAVVALGAKHARIIWAMLVSIFGRFLGNGLFGPNPGPDANHC